MVDRIFFLGVAFLPGGHFPFVTVQGFEQGRAFSLLPGNKHATVHFSFDLTGPFFGIGFIIEGFVLRWVSFFQDLGLPLVGTTFADSCQRIPPE